MWDFGFFQVLCLGLLGDYRFSHKSMLNYRPLKFFEDFIGINRNYDKGELYGDFRRVTSTAGQSR